MRIACIGGGPGGLYFAALIRQLSPDHEVTVFERNATDDTFGFGVVLSDETLGGIEHADPVIYGQLNAEFARWDDIDVHVHGAVVTSGGHGFAAIDRRRLLQILRSRCVELGVQVHTRTEAPPVATLSAHYDLVVAADGANSQTLSTWSGDFGTTREQHDNVFMWLGTDLVFDAFNFHLLDTPHGIMQIHGYPYSTEASTFIVEMSREVWQAAGFAELPGDREPPPGHSDLDSIAACEKLCTEVLRGHRLLPNNSKWQQFTTVRNRSWRHGNVVLLGDAAHTAHFSIGSGTKLAMEDALTLAACLHENTELETALHAYETERQPVVASTQRAARASLEWFEDIARHMRQDPRQFTFNLLTRSRRVTYDNLRLRDPEFVAEVDAWFANHHGRDTEETNPATAPAADTATPPMFHPLRLADLELHNRIAVSAMDMYTAVDGYPQDFHLVHLGSKALGGAGLVMTEMVCVSAPGRITPGCTGMYQSEHEAEWRRVTDFVHEHSDAAIGIQLGHSGRKGSTRRMWEGIDQPLPEDNWPIVAPSALPYRTGVNQVPTELDQAGMAEIREQFVAAAAAADRAGFDLLEVHCAHGYLLSSFLSPVTNQRTDDYGGSLAARLRYPREVVAAVRKVWPDTKPLSVRISATDWVEGGLTGEDAIVIARELVACGVDVIDVSTGQVTPEEQPAFGRSYQVPFAERIRSEVGIPTIAVGAISSYDDVNTTLLAGRADVCALGRPHLYDPHWTLHAAAEQEYSGPGARWPASFRAGSRRPQTGRTDGPRPRLELLRPTTAAPGTAHERWRPNGD